MDEIVITVERNANSGMWNAEYTYGNCAYSHCEGTAEELFYRMARQVARLHFDTSPRDGVSAEGASWAMDNA